MALCAMYDELQEIDLGEKLKAFLDRTGVSMTDVADAITRMGVEPKGKPVTKARVWNYVRGASRMPGWFESALDSAYPDWNIYQEMRKTGRQNSVGESRYTGDATECYAPLIPSLGSPDMKEALESLASETWQGRTLPVPRFLNPKFPVQYIVNNDDAPSLRVGDVVQLRPNEIPRLNRLFAVTEKATGRGFYAAWVEVQGDAVWQEHDGKTHALDSCHVDAAIIALLPQYTVGQEVGVINGGGLDITFQIVWPKKVP